jgi:ABC-2 type transport system ATP-binding protein
MLSTHLLSEVELICNSVVILNRGRLGVAKKLSELETDAAIVLEVRGPTDQVTNLLRSTDGVTQVHTQPLGEGLASYEVRTRQLRDLREEISQRIARNGWIIRRLDLSRRRLDDRFYEVLRQEDPLKGTAHVPSEAAQGTAS